VENENYEIEFMNDSLVKKFGNLVGEKCYRAIKGRDEPCEHCPVKEILHKGKMTHLRYQSTDKHGNVYDLIASPMKNPDGSISIIEIVRDITDMKQAEEALRGSEEMYKTLVRTSPEAVTVTDLEGNITYVSQRTVELHRFKKTKELIGKNAFELISPEDHENAAANLRKTLEEGVSRGLEYTLLRKDGTTFTGELNAALIKDAHGKPNAFIATTRDITERRDAREALRESEEEFRLTFENAKDAIIWADPETGLITNCNKATETLLERERHEIIGQHQTKLHSPEKVEYYGNQFKEHIERNGAVDDEAEIITKSGKIKPVHISASVTLIRGKPVIQGIFSDITERKKAEDQIRYLNELKRSVIDNAPFGILTSDEEGNIIHANPALIKIMGSPSEEKTKSFNLFKLAAIKKAGLDKVFKKVLLEGKEFDLEKEYVSHWGKRIFARIKVLPLRNAKSEVTGLVTLVEDITEKKNLEAKIAPVPEPLVIPGARSISP